MTLTGRLMPSSLLKFAVILSAADLTGVSAPPIRE